MKVGDLVSLKMKKTNPPQQPMIGVVIWVDRRKNPSQIKVHWQKHGRAVYAMCPTKFHEVLSESR